MDVNTAELRSLLNSGEPYALVDVRERGEFALQQIPGASPLPRGTIEYRVESAIPDHGVPVVVCCDDGRRSALAAATLGEMGYRDVGVLSGGVEGWVREGLPTWRGWSVAGKEYAERVAVREDVPQIAAAELRERRRRGSDLLVVDVRSEEEYLRGHVPGAFHVPGGELLHRLPDLLQGEGTTVVTCCAGRTRGILSAHMLRRAGWPGVRALTNGAMGWWLAGFDLESGPGARPPLHAGGTVAEWVRRATDRLASAQQVRSVAVEHLGRFPTCYLLDVRLPEAYLAGHVPGSVSIPAGQIALHHETHVMVRNVPIVVLADDAIRPVWAAALLQDLGFRRTYVLGGGIPAWTAAGRGLETGRPTVEVHGLADARRRASGIAAPDLRSGTVLLDVRSSGEFGAGHIPGARWLPRGRLELAVGTAVPDRRQPLATVCDTGIRSTLAAATLRTMGYADVRYLLGGVDGWRAAGRPIDESLDGADVTREEAQADFGHTVWSGGLGKTRGDMERYLRWEESLGRS